MTKQNDLSNREQEVIRLLLEGKSNKQIASSLVVSVRTVEFHLKNIYEKVQVSSRLELVLKLGVSTATGEGTAPGEKEILGISTGTDAKESPEMTAGSSNAERLGRATGRVEEKGPVISTVADKEEGVQNKDWLNLRMNWATSWRETVSFIKKEIKMVSPLSANVGSEGSTSSEGSTKTFFEAIRVCLIKYAEFEGRATRSEFWWFALFVTLVAGALAYLSQNVSNVFLVAMLLPFLAAGARRLHDIGKSGWWQLFLLAPFAGVILPFLWAQPTENSLAEEKSVPVEQLPA